MLIDRNPDNWPAWTRGRAARSARNVMFGLLALLLFVIYFPTWRFAPELRFSILGDPPAEATAELSHIAGLFLEACPHAATYRADIANATIRYVSPFGIWEGDGLGWKHPVEIVLKVNDRAWAVPDKWFAHGHTLRYVIGAAGDKVGLTATKDVEKLFCDMPAQGTSRSTLKPVPGFAFLDR